MWLKTEKPTDITHTSTKYWLVTWNIPKACRCRQAPMKPAGFPKAWPTKPKSVSHWPGLAGVKAARLSAGWPGHLRTLCRSYLAMAETCPTYLNSQQVKGLLTAPFPDAWNTFLEYFSVCLRVQVKKSSGTAGDHLRWSYKRQLWPDIDQVTFRARKIVFFMGFQDFLSIQWTTLCIVLLLNCGGCGWFDRSGEGCLV